MAVAHGSDPESQAPSEWVRRFAPLISAHGRVLDLACGSGRHARFLRTLGCRVTAIDRDEALVRSLQGMDGIDARLADLEGQPWPLDREVFDGVVVVNYLHRPLFSKLISVLAEGGVLIYETFAVGNEQYGRPSNPEFLLRRGELLEWIAPQLQVVAFEQGIVSRPKPAVIERICAVRAGPEWLRLEATS
jgi:SAM-dependent methyltransferase